MAREGWTLTKVTDAEELAWEDHRYWQSLSVGERLRLCMEMNEAAFAGKVFEAVNGRERLRRPANPAEQA